MWVEGGGELAKGCKMMRGRAGLKNKQMDGVWFCDRMAHWCGEKEGDMATATMKPSRVKSTDFQESGAKVTQQISTPLHGTNAPM